MGTTYFHFRVYRVCRLRQTSRVTTLFTRYEYRRNVHSPNDPLKKSKHQCVYRLYFSFSLPSRTSVSRVRPYIPGSALYNACCEGCAARETTSSRPGANHAWINSVSAPGRHLIMKRPAKHQAPVVQTLDSAILWINHYPLDNSIGFASVYPLDSNLSGGQRYPSFEQLGPECKSATY